MSVRRAQREIDSREFAWWTAFSRLEPIGEARADLRMAALAAAIVNSHRVKGPRATIKDFLFDFEPVAEKSDDEIFEMVKAWNAALGGTFVEKVQ